MNKKKKVPKKSKEKEQLILPIYVHTVYKFLGRKLLKVKKFKPFFDKNIYNSKYEDILKKADLHLLPEEYFVSIYISLIGSLFLVLLLTGIFFYINTLIAVLAFYGGVVGVALLGIFFYNYPVVRAKNRAQEIDAAIPYLLPYMKILAKELNLNKIIAIIDEFLIYKEIQIEFRRIKHYSDFLGYDINNSIREAMASCPSRQLADLMNDLVTISNSGGNIYSYLERKLDNLNQEIEAIEKKNIDTLLIFSQIYVVLLLIAPLFFAIMNTILNLIQFGSESGLEQNAGSTVGVIIMLLFFLPIAYGGFMMLVYYAKPLYSRLKSIKNESQ